MTDWFAKLMQDRQARSRPVVDAAARPEKGEGRIGEIVRHTAVVRALRERQDADRAAREKRLSGYAHAPGMGSPPGRRSNGTADAVGIAAVGGPARLYRIPTRVPCRATPAAHALLAEIAGRCPGATVIVRRRADGRQAVLLIAAAGTEPTQIGWVEHCIQSDPLLCNVRHQGLTVDADGDGMLVLRFRYPATATCRPARSGDDQTIGVDFTEIRSALELWTAEADALPPLAMLAPHEIDLINATGSRDYEAFHTRLKQEVMAGVWTALGSVLRTSPDSGEAGGCRYTVVRHPDPGVGRIRQTTVADDGGDVDVGLDRVYDAATATDLLVLYLDGDILADLAEIFFATRRLPSEEALAEEDEFFGAVRRFWAGARGLCSPFGGDPPAVARMALRVLPTPVQAGLLRGDWTTLRQRLIARYGERGQLLAERPAPRLTRGSAVPASWPFATAPAGSLNVGLRLVYRQEWRFRGSRLAGARGPAVLPTGARVQTPRAAAPGNGSANDAGSCPLEADRHDPPARSRDLVQKAVDAAARAMTWPVEVDGSIRVGLHGLGSRTDMGLEAERRESSRHASTRITGTVRRVASGGRSGPDAAGIDPSEGDPADGVAGSDALDGGAEAPARRRVLDEYDVMTRLAEVQDILMIAEPLPAPDEIDARWVVRHQVMLAKELLDESCRDALEAIVAEARPAASLPTMMEVHGTRDATVSQLESFTGTVRVDGEGVEMAGQWNRGRRENVGEWQKASLPDGGEGAAVLALEGARGVARDRLYEHIRANILHYQRAVWREEDPQQRAMRYRRSGRKVPLEWWFELSSRSGLTIEELGERLAARIVDGQFAAYAGGREADLDQVIDPGVLLGYCGNYAVFRMRPEFASGEMFSVLHFFRSPYLRPDPEDGLPAITDPLLMQIGEDPEVAAVTNDVLDRDRDDMVALIPALGDELARAGERAHGSEAPDADEVARRCHAILRRQYAEYRLRRSQSRRIVLDAGREMVERAGPTPAAGAGIPDGMGIFPAAEEMDRWAVRTGSDTRLLVPQRPFGADPSPAILPAACAGLFVGVGASEGREPHRQPGIALRRRAPVATLIAGLAPARQAVPDAGAVIVSRDEAAPILAPMPGARPAEGPEVPPLWLPAGAERAITLQGGTEGAAPDRSVPGPHLLPPDAEPGAELWVGAGGAAPTADVPVPAGAGTRARLGSGAAPPGGASAEPTITVPAAGPAITVPSAGRSTAAASAPGAVAPTAGSGIVAPATGGADAGLLVGSRSGGVPQLLATRLVFVPGEFGPEVTVVSGVLAA